MMTQIECGMVDVMSEPMTPGERRRRAWELSIPASAETKASKPPRSKQQARPPHEPSVYFVRIGKHVKIGYSTNIANRMKHFETSASDVQLLLKIPGDTRLERRLHALLSESHIQRELFHRDRRVNMFIDLCRHYGLAGALGFLEETTPERRSQKRQRDLSIRAARIRTKRAEKDAHFAQIVADRKKRLGW